jgi:hypothetical protein
MKITPKEKARFYTKMIPAGKCIIWAGKPDKSGYGHMLIGTSSMLVHKIAYFLKHGKEPQDYLIHTCNNKMCVNPDHIVEGKNKGRPVKVSAQIIKDLNSQGLSPSKIAEQLNCSVSLVRKRLA